MLAAQFLNVVLEENDKPEAGINDFSGNDYSSNENDHESNNNNTIYDIISQLDIKSQLAKILLSECTIEPSKIAQKREKPVLSFEANVTPIYDTPVKKPKPNDELSILNAVEAVYSDGEGEDSPTVPCPVCNRSFSRNCSLALHMKSHEPLDDATKRFQCQLCPRSYSQKSVLKKHLAECSSSGGGHPLPSHHREPTLDDSGFRRFKCQLCPRSYSQKSVLKKHLAVHTGERERCNICGAGFSQRSSLVRHAKRIHGGLVAGGSPATSSAAHSTPILTTALSGLTHPTLGTPLIVGIPLNHLAAGKYAGTPLAAAAAAGLVVKSPAQLNNSVAQQNCAKPQVRFSPPAMPVVSSSSVGEAMTVASTSAQ